MCASVNRALVCIHLMHYVKVQLLLLWFDDVCSVVVDCARS